jgi:hypothetical protein
LRFSASRSARTLALLGLGLAMGSLGCRRIVANAAAGALGGEGQAFSGEDDPELVKDAVPFALKTMDSLLEGSPDNAKLLLAASSSYTQYAYAFVVQDAQIEEDAHPAEAKEKFARAKKLLRRGWAYGFRGLEARHKGFMEAFAKDRAGALAPMKRQDVPLLYWTGAALAAQISISKDDMAMVGRLGEVEALMAKALELDEAFADGSIHEFYLAYDAGRSEAAGGSVERARKHYDRVLEITSHQKIGPLVAWAETVGVQKQDRKLFDQLLDQALAFDTDSAPRFRLVNVLAQRRAKWLKAKAADLFVEE